MIRMDISKQPHYRELIVNDHIRLIEPDVTHAKESLSWVREPEVIRYMGADFSHPTLEGEAKRIEEILQNADAYSWMIEYDGIVIGNVCINDIQETTKKMKTKAGNLTVLIGEKKLWGKGLGSLVSSTVLEWAFHEAGFQAMTARALQENIASQKTLEKLGFRETGTEPFDGLIEGKTSMWKNYVMHAGAF